MTCYCRRYTSQLVDFLGDSSPRTKRPAPLHLATDVWPCQHVSERVHTVQLANWRARRSTGDSSSVSRIQELRASIATVPRCAGYVADSSGPFAVKYGWGRPGRSDPGNVSPRALVAVGAYAILKQRAQTSYPLPLLPEAFVQVFTVWRRSARKGYRRGL